MAAAQELGVHIGAKAKALLDSHSVSFGGGTISLHNENGVPLRSLGVGSTRLLVAGLQRKAAGRASIVLSDELEYGLEPHRIARFLGSLGAKEAAAPFQAFLTTHSPVALRELWVASSMSCALALKATRPAWSAPTMVSRARSRLSRSLPGRIRSRVRGSQRDRIAARPGPVPD